MVLLVGLSLRRRAFDQPEAPLHVIMSSSFNTTPKRRVLTGRRSMLHSAHMKAPCRQTAEVLQEQAASRAARPVPVLRVVGISWFQNLAKAQSSGPYFRSLHKERNADWAPFFGAALGCRWLWLWCSNLCPQGCLLRAGWSGCKRPSERLPMEEVRIALVHVGFQDSFPPHAVLHAGCPHGRPRTFTFSLASWKVLRNVHDRLRKLMARGFKDFLPAAQQTSNFSRRTHGSVLYVQRSILG